ncbi:unnamed protein product, partial [Polarella glacialis]
VAGSQAQTASGWRNNDGLIECPLSAREGHDVGRPTTRDGNRPVTQEGGGRWRVGSFDGTRPATRDARPTTRDGRDESRHQQQSPLDGVRPSTRDGARLQQMIDGERRVIGGRATDRGDSLGTRPQTRDAARPLTRGGTPQLRPQEVSIRQVTGRKKRHSSQGASSHAPETLILEDKHSPSPEPLGVLVDWAPVEWAPECLSPCMDADRSLESADLLE